MTGRPVIYLDHAATSWPKRPDVARAVADFLESSAGNPGRSGHRLSMAAVRTLDECRDALARLIGGEPERIVLTAGATEALNIAILGAVRAAQDRGVARPHVVSTVLEHNAVARPLNLLAHRREIDLTIVDCDARAVLDPARVLDAVRLDTTLVCLTHASNALGTIQPVAAIGQELARRMTDALLLVDAAQTAGLVPIDVSRLHADLLAFSGHKSLGGPTGVGVLHIGPRAYTRKPGAGRVRMAPVYQGGTGGDSTLPFNPPELPYAFESGTPNTVGAAGLLAALRTLPAPATTLQHERALAARLLTGLAGLRGVRTLGPADTAQRTGVVSFTAESIEPQDLAGVLDDAFSICVRAGLHCAPGAHRAAGTFPLGAVRVSPGPTNTEADIDALLAALREILEA